MSPTVHCIRHGQGFHNLGAGFYDLPDPKLTPEGEAQCLALSERLFSEQSHISLIAASPMSRAIQSAALIFQPALKSSTPPKMILAVPDAQETSDDACDIGSDLEVLRNICEESQWPVDLSLVHNDWNIKKIGGRYSPSSTAIAHRARDVRLFLRQQVRDLIAAGDRNIHIVLVAHGGFLHYLTGDWEGADKRPGTGWVNCETRSYTFAGDVDNDDADADLVELTGSRQRRGLHHPMLPKARQAELFTHTMQAWENQGLQNPSKIALIEEEAASRARQATDKLPIASSIQVEA